MNPTDTRNYLNLIHYERGKKERRKATSYYVEDESGSAEESSSWRARQSDETRSSFQDMATFSRFLATSQPGLVAPEDADQCGKHRTWTGPEGWSSCYRAICCTAMSKLEKHWKLHHSNAAAIHAADQPSEKVMTEADAEGVSRAELRNNPNLTAPSGGAAASLTVAARPSENVSMCD
ncbi:hypothetical protein OIU85_024616 [Salix viminalis]|uniref:SMP domain-containing protein n=1 Tax=Salix viminalis TaxID=40686 RepID=A0A9Q0U197_SALVM|nr:hypothetical protein OIU85_024616 [Salix viminalis]